MKFCYFQRRLMLAATIACVSVPVGLASQLKLTESLMPEFAAQASSLVADAPTISFDFPALGTVDILPVRFEPRAGDGAMVASSFRCGLLISIASGKPQALTTVGVGLTETLSCDGIAEIGLVTRKSKERCIGLIYELRSPNTEYRGPLIVRFDHAAKRWLVDESLIDDSEISSNIDSIESLRTALKNR